MSLGSNLLSTGILDDIPRDVQVLFSECGLERILKRCTTEKERIRNGCRCPGPAVVLLIANHYLRLNPAGTHYKTSPSWSVE